MKPYNGQGKSRDQEERDSTVMIAYALICVGAILLAFVAGYLIAWLVMS
jgi:hypothetical protein